MVEEAVSCFAVDDEEVVAGASSHDGQIAAAFENRQQLCGMQADVLELPPEPAALLSERYGEDVEPQLVEPIAVS